ncbi:MAG: hypothetical protein VYE40_13805 [Myxococcota bacterium]|nr:hypothetical protein [Myxococcota bacterium]
MKIAKFKEIRHALGMIFSVREAPIEEDVFVYLDEDLIYAAYQKDRTEVIRFSNRHQDALKRAFARKRPVHAG